MASFSYTKFAVKMIDASTKINLAGDTIKIALLSSSYSPSRTHEFFSDVSSAEVTGTGYTTGGATLGSLAVTEDDTNFRANWDAADASWPSSSITARYAVIYKSTGTAGTSPLIALIDFGSNIASSDSTFTVVFNASGILRLSIV